MTVVPERRAKQRTGTPGSTVSASRRGLRGLVGGLEAVGNAARIGGPELADDARGTARGNLLGGKVSMYENVQERCVRADVADPG
jgi:hypothetical protein